MAIFDAHYTPTVTERLRQMTWWAGLVLFASGFSFVTFANREFEDGFLASNVLLFPAFGAVWLLSLRKVIGWLEWKRPVRGGEWRTTRASRLSGLAWVAWMAGYGREVVACTIRAKSLGDQPRFVVGVLVVAFMAVLTILVVVRLARATVELSIDEHGLRAAAWRGAVPWTAIENVVSPKSSKATDELRLVIKPEALSEMPDVVRRWNGYPRVDLSKVNLSPEEALAAMRAVYPALKVGGRSAGLILPVRGATDIVEADL